MKTIRISLIIMITVFNPALLLDINSQVCPVPEINLGNDTLICPGDALYLDAGTHDMIEWNDGSNGQYLLVTEPGVYSANVINACGNAAFDEIIIDLAEAPILDFIMPPNEYFCKGEIVNVTAEAVNDGGSVLYEWSDNVTGDATIEVDTSGNYTVTATNEFGCKTSSDISIEFQYPTEEERILLVTYDIQDGKNVVVWSKTPDRRTKRYALYTGNSEADLLDYSTFNSSNLYVDMTSRPIERPHVYNIRVQDSCDNYSGLRLEKAHRSMHLRSSITEKGNIQLEWERYVGFPYDQFYIYRATDPDNFEVIDSIKHDPLQVRMQYTDLSAEQGTRYFYIIKVNTPDTVFIENPGDRKAGNGPFVHSLSNLEDNLLLGTDMNDLDIVNQYLDVYPNPISDKTSIQYKIENELDIEMAVFSITGNEIARIFQARQPAGKHELIFNSTDYGLRPGIYILRMRVGDYGILTRKLIKQ